MIFVLLDCLLAIGLSLLLPSNKQPTSKLLQVGKSLINTSLKFLVWGLPSDKGQFQHMFWRYKDTVT